MHVNTEQVFLHHAQLAIEIFGLEQKTQLGKTLAASFTLLWPAHQI